MQEAFQLLPGFGIEVFSSAEDQKIAAFGSAYGLGSHRNIAGKSRSVQELPKAAIV
ncbi:MAG: hypothetical protein AAAB23_13945 [Pseudomonas sp.]